MNQIQKSAVKIIVSGRVQGVGFRYYIAREAERLGIKGYVRNLWNGDVEIYAEGRWEFVEEMIKKAKLGPSHFKVDSCKVEWLDFANKYDNFDVF